MNYEKLKKHYVYAESYIDRDKSGAKETVMRPSENPDSLTDLSVKMDIATPIVFDLERQGKIGGEEGAPWTMDQFIASKGAEDILNHFHHFICIIFYKVI